MDTLTPSPQGAPAGTQKKRIVREYELTAGGGCQANTQMFVSAWQRTACTEGVEAAAAACTWLSLARRRHLASPPHCHHPHFLTTHILPVLYIWFISLPSIQKDNGAVKNQACVSPFAAGASVFAKCAHKRKLFFAFFFLPGCLIPGLTVFRVGTGGRGAVLWLP